MAGCRGRVGLGRALAKGLGAGRCWCGREADVYGVAVCTLANRVAGPAALRSDLTTVVDAINPAGRGWTSLDLPVGASS